MKKTTVSGFSSGLFENTNQISVHSEVVVTYPNVICMYFRISIKYTSKNIPNLLLQGITEMYPNVKINNYHKKIQLIMELEKAALYHLNY